MTGVTLRDVTEDDLPVFFEHQREPEANRMAAFPARDREAFMAHWARVLADDRIVKKTILWDGQIAGNIVSFEQSGRRLVGFWVGQAYWGRHVASSALAAFLEQAGAGPLYSRVAKHNVRSRRVLEKCGFVICGEETAPAAAGAEPLVEWILQRAQR